jgi:hypothetical protein
VRRQMAQQTYLSVTRSSLPARLQPCLREPVRGLLCTALLCARRLDRGAVCSSSASREAGAAPRPRRRAGAAPRRRRRRARAADPDPEAAAGRACKSCASAVSEIEIINRQRPGLWRRRGGTARPLIAASIAVGADLRGSAPGGSA